MNTIFSDLFVILILSLGYFLIIGNFKFRTKKNTLFQAMNFNYNKMLGIGITSLLILIITNAKKELNKSSFLFNQKVSTTRKQKVEK